MNNESVIFFPDRVRLRRRHLHPHPFALQRHSELQVRLGRGGMVRKSSLFAKLVCTAIIALNTSA